MAVLPVHAGAPAGACQQLLPRTQWRARVLLSAVPALRQFQVSAIFILHCSHVGQVGISWRSRFTGALIRAASGAEPGCTAPNQALCKATALPRPLLRTLLAPKEAQKPPAGAMLDACSLPAGLKAGLSEHCNASQAAAIAAALLQRPCGITLIQACPSLLQLMCATFAYPSSGQYLLVERAQ